jgi:transcriptional regulator GlxA family with amidase domain
MREHLRRPLTVAAMAGHAGYSPRTFARRFVDETGTSPLRWLTRERVREAQRLLEATSLGIDGIATESGLGSAAALRKHFSRELGTSPTAYRRAFGQR